MDVASFAGDPRWQATERILQSLVFRRSPRLCQLLAYMAEQSLLDEHHQLTETAIAVHVFGRDSSFDPAIDTIVRSQMVRLREKLEQYYHEDKGHEAIRIVVPKGKYQIHFEQVLSLPTVLAEPDLKVASEFIADSHVSSISQPTPAQSGRKISWLSVVLGGLCLLLSVSLFTVVRHDRHAALADVPESHQPIWDAMFQRDTPTTYVAPDSGLVLLHEITHKPTSLAEYIHRDFGSQLQDISPSQAAEAVHLANRRYTSVVDLSTVQHLDMIAMKQHSKLRIKFARDLRLDDLKQGNIILGGAQNANPWHELFNPELTIVGEMNPVDYLSYRFINKHPNQGEKPIYTVSATDPKHRVLGYAAYIPGLDGKNKVLIIEGSSVTGGDAICDFLFNDSPQSSFLEKIKRPDGSLPYFELLLEADGLDGSAGPFHVLVYHQRSQ